MGSHSQHAAGAPEEIRVFHYSTLKFNGIVTFEASSSTSPAAAWTSLFSLSSDTLCSSAVATSPTPTLTQALRCPSSSGALASVAMATTAAAAASGELVHAARSSCEGTTAKPISALDRNSGCSGRHRPEHLHRLGLTPLILTDTTFRSVEDWQLRASARK